MSGNKTNIGNLDQKMEMLNEAFRQCIENYDYPLRFMTSVDALIQGIRNYTFAIQSNKKSIPDFDQWYGLWQEVMKNEPYMRWLNQSRVEIVHGDVLTTKSNATLTLDTDHLQTIKTEHYDIMTSTPEIVASNRFLADKNPALKHATGTIRRSYYFEVGGKDVDATTLLYSGLMFLEIMRADLVIYLESEKLVRPEMPPLEGNFIFPVEIMTVKFRLRDGKIINEHVVPVSREKMLEGAEEAVKRYGNFKNIKKENTKDKRKVIRFYFDLAKRIFEIDQYHVTMLHVHDKKGWTMTIPMIRDRSEKIAFWRSFAETIKQRGIDEIIFTSETWTLSDRARVEKQIQAGKEVSALRKKGEALMVFYANKKGTSLEISAPIIREDESVKLGKSTFTEVQPKDYPIFFPVYNTWGLLDDSPEDKTYAS